MWRHEDIYRVLFGGTDFATGEPLADEYDLAICDILANGLGEAYAFARRFHFRFPTLLDANSAQGSK